jgi:hypothetical protein
MSWSLTLCRRDFPLNWEIRVRKVVPTSLKLSSRHIEAVRRLGNVDVIGLVGSSLDSARRKAAEFRVPRPSPPTKLS